VIRDHFIRNEKCWCYYYLWCDCWSLFLCPIIASTLLLSLFNSTNNFFNVLVDLLSLIWTRQVWNHIVIPFQPGVEYIYVSLAKNHFQLWLVIRKGMWPKKQAMKSPSGTKIKWNPWLQTFCKRSNFYKKWLNLLPSEHCYHI